ncbi:MAG: hypothetical protein QF483_06915 [Gammaproteobacteria bacterium]|jgi:hypothetical protein|nr:hypothetical protein [Gammaproteobacteria bacterium]HJP04283.1 hypothetical protein [Gammaproteobacteria bacterium]
MPAATMPAAIPASFRTFIFFPVLLFSLSAEIIKANIQLDGLSQSFFIKNHTLDRMAAQAHICLCAMLAFGCS